MIHSTWRPRRLHDPANPSGGVTLIIPGPWPWPSSSSCRRGRPLPLPSSRRTLQLRSPKSLRPSLGDGTSGLRAAADGWLTRLTNRASCPLPRACSFHQSSIISHFAFRLTHHYPSIIILPARVLLLAAVRVAVSARYSTATAESGQAKHATIGPTWSG